MLELDTLMSNVKAAACKYARVTIKIVKQLVCVYML